MLNRKLMIELLLKSKRVCVVIYNFEIIKSRSSFTRSILRVYLFIFKYSNLGNIKRHSEGSNPSLDKRFRLKNWCRCISSSGSLCTNNEYIIYKNNIPDYASKCK